MTSGRQPRVLDACCCAGGAGYGYKLAGFHVTGVDIKPRPRYAGDVFIQGDAIDYVREHGAEYDFLHASWPCQRWTKLNAYNRKDYPDLLTPGRAVMTGTGVPFVIENVLDAPLRNPYMLCGTMFGLRLRRHRGFETGNGFELPFWQIPCGRHQPCVRNGYLPTPQRPHMTLSGGKHSAAWVRKAAEVIGMPWVETVEEVCEAIPPAYTEWIGRQWLAQQLRIA